MKEDVKDLQVFRLSEELINSFMFDNEYIENIFFDMCEAGVAFPPYPRFALEFNVDTFMCLLNLVCSDAHNEHARKKVKESLSDVRKWFIEYDINEQVLCGHARRDGNFYSPLVRGSISQVLYNNQIRKSSFDQEKDCESTIISTVWWIFAFFIVLLSTKNIKKDTKIHDCMTRKRVPDSKKYRKDYPYTTTLSIGKITENYDGSEFTGVSRRPHLRRGHVRTQHYGPKNELTKKIFVQSVFVNGSEDMKSNRVAYNVSIAA